MLIALDHINLHCDDPDALAFWYETILGLKRGPRPNFSVPGLWLYMGEQPVLHILKAAEPLQRAPVSLEHFALYRRHGRLRGDAEGARHPL